MAKNHDMHFFDFDPNFNFEADYQAGTNHLHDCSDARIGSRSMPAKFLASCRFCCFRIRLASFALTLPNLCHVVAGTNSSNADSSSWLVVAPTAFSRRPLAPRATRRLAGWPQWRYARGRSTRGVRCEAVQFQLEKVEIGRFRGSLQEATASSAQLSVLSSTARSAKEKLIRCELTGTLCVRRKTKCDKQVPCSACVRRGNPLDCFVEGGDEVTTLVDFPYPWKPVAHSVESAAESSHSLDRTTWTTSEIV